MRCGEVRCGEVRCGAARYCALSEQGPEGNRPPPPAGVKRLVEDAERLEPYFLNLASGQE